jgi:hypothetical protein
MAVVVLGQYKERARGFRRTSSDKAVERWWTNGEVGNVNATDVTGLYSLVIRLREQGTGTVIVWRKFGSYGDCSARDERIRV